MSFEFTKEELEYIEELSQRYPSPKALMLPLLWIIQNRLRHIPTEAFKAVADITKTSEAQVYGVVTFYTMFTLKPTAKYHIELCKTLSCNLCGSKELLNLLKERFNLLPNQQNGDFQLTLVECLGSCGTAPVVQINNRLYENLTPAKLQKILEDFS